MDALLVDDPTRLGPFRVLGRLGAGGMGQVYLGRDVSGRLAAIKVIHGNLTGDPEFRARFAREIALAQHVRSPWTAAVLGADPNAASPWLATEYIAGPPLDDVVATTGPLPEHTVHALAVHLANALAAMHAKGVVHRDIKPSNVLLAGDGPRLIDFGIARAIDSTKITHTGHVIGTPAYMSPEQALCGDTSAPSDVFSLAGVLVFAASATPPFGHTTNPVAMLRRVSVEEPDLSLLPPGMRTVLGPCFAKRPAARPTAQQLAAVLGPPTVGSADWLPPHVTALVRQTGKAAGTGTGKRRRTLLTVAGALVTVVALVAGAITLANGFASTGPATPVAAPTTTAPPPTPQPTQTGSPAPAPPPVVSAGVIPSKIPGWLATVSTSRNAAYDVPPPWKPGSPGLIRGYEKPNGEKIVMSGVATLEGKVCGPENRPYTIAWSGVTGHTSGDTATAATEVANLWVGSFAPDDARQPQARTAAPVSVTANGKQASHVVTELDVPTDGCNNPRGAIHTVAMPANGGQSVVWVLLTDRDVPGAVTDADLAQMIASLRPAGLGEKCERPERTVGNWC
jgi:hypothetical protein